MSRIRLRVERARVRWIRRTPARVLRSRHGEPPTIDGYTLETRIHAFGSILREQGKQRPAEVSIEFVRGAFDRLMFLGSADPHSRVATRDQQIPGPGGDLAIRVYRPTRSVGTGAAIVWFHQGGSVLGGLETDRTLCAEIAARADAVVVSVDYRLGPEHPYPADVVDALAAYEWTVANAAGLGIDAARVGIGGSSAGGRLAAAVALERRSEGLAIPPALVLVYPTVDQHEAHHEGSMVSMADAWPLGVPSLQYFRAASHAGGVVPDLDDVGPIHRLSPLRAPGLAGLPPTVVVTAGFDPLRDQGNAFAAAAIDAGVDVTARCETTLCHSFTAMGGVSRAAGRATRRLAHDVASVLDVD